MRRCAVLALLFIVLVGPGAAAEPNSAAGGPADPENCAAAAARIKPDQSLPEAEQERRLRQIVRICPELAEAYANLGSVLIRRNAVKEAKECFEKAFAIHEDAAFIVGLGAVAAASNDLIEAEAQYQRALLLDANSSQALQGLAFLHISKDSLQEAERLLRRAAQLTPEDPLLFYNFGVVLVRQGKLPEAIASFRAALERKSDYPEAREQLTRALLRESRFDEAEQLLRAALDQDNSDVLAAVMLSSVLEARGQLKPAEKVLAALESRAPDRTKTDFNVQLARAVLKIKRGKIRRGIEMLEELGQSNPTSRLKALRRDDPSGRLNSALGWAYLQQGEILKSVEFLNKALRENPKDHLARINLEVAESISGR